MKKIKIITLTIAVSIAAVVASGFTKSVSSCQKSETLPAKKTQQKNSINMFVTHGHCSTPFAGNVDNIRVELGSKNEAGNPLENMKISFQVDPNSFNACRGDDLTKAVKTPGLFIGDNDEKITFRTTEVYTMGLDWYQVNGKMSIKGEEHNVKFFATSIRDAQDIRASSMIIEGQLNLLDWGIDYDKIVNGKSSSLPTKWMHFNMSFDMC